MTRKHQCDVMTGDVFGGFRTVELLGSGFVGSVWKAVQVSLGREVALRVWSPHDIQDQKHVDQFIQELKASVILIDERGEPRLADFGQALLIMGAILSAPLVKLFSVRLPLEPIHILWVNLSDSVFLTLPLMMELKEKGLLHTPPRDPDEKIANRLFFERVGLVSVMMALTGFATYYYFGSPAIAGELNAHLLTQAQTAAFVSIQLLHIGFLATARSIEKSVFTLNPFSNRWVLLGVGLTVACQFMIVYVPFLQKLFRTAAFPLEWWPIVAMGFFPGLIAVEIEKWIRRRRAE
ncbi:MAG: hypothetical protein C0404_02785 [Verrucomicrobia bacterium]|nr:hypothetical protein [Verrucomicrobiota bacterium]